MFRSVPDGGAPPAGRGGRHSRRRGIADRLRRRILAYRHIELLAPRLPGEAGAGEERLLLVHVRKVVGEVHYRICPACAEGVITVVDIDARFQGTGLDTRALSHLRSRHPGMSWRSTLSLRTTRDLLRRMRIPTAAVDSLCTHARALATRARPAL
ncbi:hypothetical protein ACFWUW_05900 [Streptomyces sp. NPDC058655]|uniref:hypothetical protein n=1 Tax=unclassified Streptomyces TaxID=2593676 RepID=UPI0036490F5C